MYNQTWDNQTGMWEDKTPVEYVTPEDSMMTCIPAENDPQVRGDRYPTATSRLPIAARPCRSRAQPYDGVLCR